MSLCRKEKIDCFFVWVTECFFFWVTKYPETFYLKEVCSNNFSHPARGQAASKVFTVILLRNLSAGLLEGRIEVLLVG